MSELTHAMADQLRQYATHFSPRDWDYTRKHNITRIGLAGDRSGYDNPIRRIGRVVREFTHTDALSHELGLFPWRHPIITLRVGLGTDRHLPDGVLDGGAVITHWEETGEYLQYVQPSVGALLADLMDAHPDLPEVEAIAAEMKRINDRYGERIAAESKGDDE